MPLIKGLRATTIKKAFLLNASPLPYTLLSFDQITDRLFYIPNTVLSLEAKTFLHYCLYKSLLYNIFPHVYNFADMLVYLLYLDEEIVDTDLTGYKNQVHVFLDQHNPAMQTKTYLIVQNPPMSDLNRKQPLFYPSYIFLR